MISDSMRFDMAGFYRYLKENAIRDCELPTQLGMELMQAYELPLAWLTLGGEKLKKLPQKEGDAGQRVRTDRNFTVCSSYFIVDQDKEYENIPIGKPVAIYMELYSG